MNMLEFATAVPTVSDAGSIRIYPNPVAVSFKIDGIDAKSTVSLFDLNGRELLSKQLYNNESIFVDKLSKGVYLVKINSDGLSTDKILLKK